MIKRMIGRQYDQLLEICKQTKAEIDDLNRNLTDSDFVQRLEIEKMQALISSIEHDVQTKKQDIYNSEIKNRYQQLTNLYQQTRDEVRLLESTLETNIQKVDQSQNRMHDNEMKRNPADRGAKRERLDLSTPIEPQDHDVYDEEMLKKWQASLNKIDELEEQQQLLETLEPSVPDVAPLTLAEPVTIQSEEEIIPIEEPIVEEVVEIEENIDPIPTLDKLEAEGLEIPSVVQIEPEIPMLPPLPVVPALPVLPVEDEEPELEEQVEDQVQALPIQGQKTLTNEKRDVVNQPSKGKKAIGAILNILFYFILTISILFVFLFGMYKPDGAPRVLFGYSIMRVATESMSPALPVNTLIVTKDVDPADLQVGDVVTFIRFNETIITHRIYEIYEDYQNRGVRGFRLIGDANGGEPDYEVHHADHLIGRVVASNYPFGHFLMFIYHQFLLLMAFVVTILIVLFLFRRKLVLKGAKEKA